MFSARVIFNLSIVYFIIKKEWNIPKQPHYVSRNNNDFKLWEKKKFIETVVSLSRKYEYWKKLVFEAVWDGVFSTLNTDLWFVVAKGNFYICGQFMNTPGFCMWTQLYKHLEFWWKITTSRFIEGLTKINIWSNIVLCLQYIYIYTKCRCAKWKDNLLDYKIPSCLILIWLVGCPGSLNHYFLLKKLRALRSRLSHFYWLYCMSDYKRCLVYGLIVLSIY
jgi:hypothetical protein